MTEVSWTRKRAKKSREWDERISDSRKRGTLIGSTQFVSCLRPASKALVRELARALQKGLARDGKIFAAFPTKKLIPETSRVSRGFPLMNSKKILALSAILLGGVVSSAFATTASSHANVAKAVAFEAPVVAKLVSPTGLSQQHKGTTVTVSMTIDDKGQPCEINVHGNDAKLKRSLVAAVSQWQFTPAKKNGVAVSSHIVVPVELVDSRSS